MAGFWLKTLRKISTKLVDVTLRWNCLSKRLLGRTLFGEKLFRDSGKKAVQNFSWIKGGVCGTHLVYQTFTWTVQWTRFIGCSIFANIQGGNYVHYVHYNVPCSGTALSILNNLGGLRLVWWQARSLNLSLEPSESNAFGNRKCQQTFV